MQKSIKLSPFVGFKKPETRFLTIFKIIKHFLNFSKTIAFITIFLYIIAGVININKPKNFNLDYNQLIQEQNLTFTKIADMFKQTQEDASSINFFIAKTTKIIDGDTIEVKIIKSYDKANRIPTNTTCKVRYIGINTPEIAHSSYEHDQPLAKEATELNRELVTGHDLILVPDIQLKDKYGRCLFYVFRDDGLMVNWTLWHLGYAKQMTIPPNVNIIFK